MKVVGIIIRRKSFGKWLAFATLKVLSIEEHNNNNETTSATEPKEGITAEEESPSRENNGGELVHSKHGIETEIINDEAVHILRVVFQRDSHNWDKDYDHTFPVKNSMLPYGAKIKALIERRLPDEKSGCNQEVCSWQMIDDPRVIALQDAKQTSQRGSACTGTSSNTNTICHGETKDGLGHEQSSVQHGNDEGGVLLHKYLKSRGLYYLKYNDRGKNKQSAQQSKTQQSTQENTTSQETNDSIQTKPKKSSVPSTLSTLSTSSNPHGDKKAKSLRAKIFAAWLVQEFGQNLLQQHNGLLDIAGGKGQLSVELAILCTNIQCTIIDPFIRGRSSSGKFLPNKEMKRIQKVHGKVPQHVAKYFLNNEESNRLVKECSCVVGLHPDQPTEDIVDLALLNNKPFAIIPCCVFPCLFPTRKLASGKFVQSYDDFVKYLLEKDDRFQTTTLNFEGKNLVIYFKGDEKGMTGNYHQYANETFCKLSL